MKLGIASNGMLVGVHTSVCLHTVSTLCLVIVGNNPGGVRANTRILSHNSHETQQEQTKEKNIDLTRFDNCLRPRGKREERSY